MDTVTTDAPASPDISTNETPVTKETPQPVAAAPKSNERMFKVKINGKEEVWPESKVLERAQKAEGAEQAFKKADQYEKAFGMFIQKTQDPAQLLELLQSPAIKYDEDKQEALAKAMLNSKNPRIINAVKQWIYENEIEPTTLTEEQKKIRELEAFKADREKRERLFLEEQARIKQESDIKNAWNSYRVQIGTELKNQGMIDDDEYIVGLVARQALLAKQQGKPADIAAAVGIVKQKMVDNYRKLHARIPDDKIFDYMDLETAKKINKAFQKQLESKEKERTIKSEAKPKKSSSEETKKWLRDLERGIV